MYFRLLHDESSGAMSYLPAHLEASEAVFVDPCGADLPVLAGQALEQKATVRVLLCDAAGDIALVGKEMPTLKPRNLTPQQMLQGVIKAGASVEVCALYLPDTGKQASDLIAGVTPARPAEVAAHLLNQGVQRLAF